MKVIIIAAGSAIRLEKLTGGKPKGLLKINGKSILERQIEIFKKNKIHDIIIITGQHSGKFNFKNVQYIPDKEYFEHDVLGSIMVAQHVMNDELIFSYSDILFDESVFEKILHFKGDIGIGVDLDWEKSYEGRSEHPKEQADNVIIQNDEIIKIKKNVSYCSKEQNLGEFIGLTKLSKNGCHIFIKKYLELEKSHIGKFQNSPSFKKAYLTDMLQELIDNKQKILPIIIHGKWYEIDTPQDLEKAKTLFIIRYNGQFWLFWRHFCINDSLYLFRETINSLRNGQ